MSAPIRIGLVGASGRMGGTLLNLLSTDAELAKRFEVVWKSQRQGAVKLEVACPQVVIDFSSPTGTLAVAAECAKNKIPLLVCTTGFSVNEEKQLHDILSTSVWAWEPNTSLGVKALHLALESVAKVLPGFEISMREVHHAHKKDKPSGTAKALLATLQKFLPKSNPVREIPVDSLREGEVIGVHSVIFEGPEETLEIKHIAHDRKLFARGALELAAQLLKKSQI